MKYIKFIDLFAGIGGFRLALESNGAKCVFSSEINKFARQTYEANFNELPAGDIKLIDPKDIPDFDILCAGFPCQPFSHAGSRKGFNDERGTLFDEIIRIAEAKEPQVLFLENVPGLLSHDKGNTFNIILNKLNNIGYTVHYKILKACDYGLPTYRPRIYIIALKNKNICFNWPHFVPLRLTMSDVLRAECEKEIGYTIRVGGAGSSINDKHNWDSYTVKVDKPQILSDVREGKNVLHSWDIIKTTDREKEICLAILRNRRKKMYGNRDGNPLTFTQLCELIPGLDVNEILNLCDKNILKEINYGIVFVNSRQLSGINGTYRIFSKDTQIYSTLTASGGNDKIDDGTQIRKLTIDEMKMMMGFPEDFKFPVSKSQAMKQIGNSVAIDVIKAIGNEIIKSLYE